MDRYRVVSLIALTVNVAVAVVLVLRGLDIIGNGLVGTAVTLGFLAALAWSVERERRNKRNRGRAQRSTV